MVVAIHTFPFQSIAPFLDEVITLTVFRVAVPFFFMITGYFLLGRLSLNFSYNNSQRVKKYLYKIGMIYLYSILLYFPLSLLNGTISLKMNILLKVLIFDGSFYHLWYFPAIIIGTILVSLLLRSVGFKLTVAFSICLYLVGLGGDSWYGIVSQIPLLNKLYSFIFSWTDYTRSGLFFAPIFLCLGILVYRKNKKLTALKGLNLLFYVFIIGMIIESIFLHRFTNIKHDSMYLLLPLGIFILFLMLLKWQPKLKVKESADLTLLVYIIHPLVIVIVHSISNYIPILKNSLLNFLLVVVCSFILAQFLLNLKRKRRVSKQKILFERASKEISASAIHHNINEVRKIIPENTNIMGVVKANAYGCGMVEVAHELEKNGISFFCVATIEEAIALRKSGNQGEILILGYTHPDRIHDIKKYDLTQSIVSEEHGKMLNLKKIPIRCHLQVDTGMHRLGVTPNVTIIQQMYRLSNLKIEGIYSHLGSSDSLELESIVRTNAQIFLFNNILSDLKQMGISYGYTHIQSSYGILNYPELNFDFVRVGILCYGFLSDYNIPTKITIDLQPIVKVKASLITKRVVDAGEYVGYGLGAKVEKRTRIGVVSIGYADGIPRTLSNAKLTLEFKGQPIKQIGNICMDMMIVDLTEVEDISVNDELIVLPNISKIADEEQTITNELLSRLGSRLGVGLS
ncbi:amino-acid racemase [Enterococcus caccae]|nr:amino-acid racemase [Enterococcus caccae]